jgi:hypothetical protein
MLQDWKVVRVVAVKPDSDQQASAREICGVNRWPERLNVI